MSDSAILGRSPWYRSLNRTQWKALIASNLGWTFDGFEVFALILTIGAALHQLLDPSEYARIPFYAGAVIAITVFGWGLGGMLGGILANYIGRKRSMTLTAGADAAIAHADTRHLVIDLEPPCRARGRSSALRCRVHRRSRNHKWPVATARASSTPHSGVRLVLTDSASESHAKYWNGIAICTLKTLGATIIVSSLSPWRFCGGLLSRPPVGFARCGAQRGALRRLW